MSKGSGKIERRIGELFAATKGRALSIGELAAYAFELTDGIAPNRKQRLSATRAAHRLMRRASEAMEAVETAFGRMVAETTAALGRPPNGRRDHIFAVGRQGYIGVDTAFGEAMQTVPGQSAWQQAWVVLERERGRCKALFADFRSAGWRTTETKDRRLWFHPADYPGTGLGSRDRPGRRSVGRRRDHRD